MEEEQKRPVLSLKRRESSVVEPVHRRKTVVHVTTPPEWKVKKQQKAERVAREAVRARVRRELSVYLKLLPLASAVATLQPWWPGLFEGETPRLLARGVREQLFADAVARAIPLSHKKILRALKAITRSQAYQAAMKAGACRYNPDGTLSGTVTPEDEAFAVARLEKQRRQDEKKAAIRAELETV